MDRNVLHPAWFELSTDAALPLTFLQLCRCGSLKTAKMLSMLCSVTCCSCVFRHCNIIKVKLKLRGMKMLFFNVPSGRSHVCPWLRSDRDHCVGSAAAMEKGPRVVRSGSPAKTWTQSCGYKGAYGRIWRRKRRNCWWTTCIQHR